MNLANQKKARRANKAMTIKAGE